MINIEVAGVGPYTAKLMVVGEAPGKYEIERKEPFVGPSGEILFDVFNMYNVRRPDLYITNVYKVRIPGDNIKNLSLVLDKEQQQAHKDFLLQEIRAINPNCILALGNTALEALTGKTGILNYRGSILKTDFNGWKVIPTIHPAALTKGNSKDDTKELFSWKQIIFLRFDIKRALVQSQFKQYNVMNRQTHIVKTAQDMWRQLQRFKGRDKAANDIETYKTIPHCAGLAFTYYEAIVFPLFNIPGPGDSSINIPRYERVGMWQQYAQFLAGPVKKVGQNYNFDQTIQERYGFKINNIGSDIILKMATLYPEIPKKLAVSTSIFTDQCYYKNEGKEYNPKKDRPQVLMDYNGKDCMVTLEIDDETDKELDNIMQGKGLLN